MKFTEYHKIRDEFTDHFLKRDEDNQVVGWLKDDEVQKTSDEFMHAKEKYKEYNQYPLDIAVYKFAIKLLLLHKQNRLSEKKMRNYNTLLEKKLLERNLPSHDINGNVDTLTLRLKIAMQLNDIIVDISKRKQSDTNQINQGIWRGGRKMKSNKRKTTTIKSATIKSATIKSKTRKSVAAGIKDISLLKARADFAALKAIPCADINQAAKVGNAVMDHYFFGHRLAAKTKRTISYYDWIKTDWKRNESEHSFYKFNRAQGKTPEKARYAVFRLYYGAIHGFKPLVAKWMYCTYKPISSILDFSAGWGGRCLGAMALGIPYIGIDTNTDLRPVYERMAKELDAPNQAVTMRFQDAATVDYSKFKYDMVLTSPPYFKTVKPVEDYAHMPDYKDRADFNARFLFPVIRNTYANLARGGTYALNIPADMYDEIKAAGVLPPRLFAKHRLFLQPRFAKGNPKHPDVKYEEYIYVWKK